MPTYTYLCHKDQKRFTVFKRMSEMLLEEPCPKCGELSTKQIDRATFVLKGGGWGPRPDPKIPDKYKNIPDDELDDWLGLNNDGNANA